MGRMYAPELLGLRRCAAVICVAFVCAAVICVAGAGGRMHALGVTNQLPPTNHQLSAPVSGEVGNMWGYPVL